MAMRILVAGLSYACRKVSWETDGYGTSRREYICSGASVSVSHMELNNIQDICRIQLSTTILITLSTK
jgi:hypothetical protein